MGKNVIIGDVIGGGGSTNGGSVFIFSLSFSYRAKTLGCGRMSLTGDVHPQLLAKTYAWSYFLIASWFIVPVQRQVQMHLGLPECDSPKKDTPKHSLSHAVCIDVAAASTNLAT
eukprot:14111890-Ditylum_brightwellii.AAC.1